MCHIFFLLSIGLKLVLCLYEEAYYKAKTEVPRDVRNLKSPETRQVQEILVSTLEHLQAPKWDRTRCPEE